MHAMWKPQKFKCIYLLATLYVFTLTIPSASAVYWAFGDELLNHANAFSLLPKNGFRDAAVILMLIHQVCLILAALIGLLDCRWKNLYLWFLMEFDWEFGFVEWRSSSHLGLRVRHCTLCGRR